VELQESCPLNISQVIVPTANSSASKKVVTAALLVIGSKILSGRTKDQNIGYIAEYLTAVGIDLKEVRVVGNQERAIVDALNELRRRCTYVFTTGGIGPTHGDITADCVAKAFGVPIDTDPRALAILHEWVKTTGTGGERGAPAPDAYPHGADLILNKVSGAPGFWIGNVIVMAGVPSIMQAMLDEVAPKLKVGVRMFSETVRADLAGEPQWRMTPHNPSPIWRNHISGALALRSQPTGVVLPDNGHRLCGVVHAARYLHILGARQLESGAQHLCARPFNQATPHRTCENKRGVVEMTHLQELPDHHRFQQRS